MRHLAVLERVQAYLMGDLKMAPDDMAKEVNDYLITVQTHGWGCWSWGPAHYMCAVTKIKELEDDRK